MSCREIHLSVSSITICKWNKVTSMRHTFLKELFLGLLPKKAEGENKPEAGSLEK